MRHYAEQMQAQKQQHEELMAALVGRLGRKTLQLTATYARGNLSPPRSDDDDDAVNAKVEALDEASRLKVATHVTRRVGASPPRENETARSATQRGLKRCAEDAGLDTCGFEMRLRALKMAFCGLRWASVDEFNSKWSYWEVLANCDGDDSRPSAESVDDARQRFTLLAELLGRHVRVMYKQCADGSFEKVNEDKTKRQRKVFMGFEIVES